MSNRRLKYFGFLVATIIVFNSCFKDDLLKEINDLKTQVTNMQKLNDALNGILNARADSLSQALSTAQKRSDSLSIVLRTKSDSLALALGLTNSNLANISRSVDSIKTQIATISGQLTQLNLQLTSITTQLSQLNQQMGALSADVSRLAGQYATLNASLQTINTQIAALQAEQLKQLEKLNAILLQLNPPVDVTTGLVAYYPFNGNAGDSSGNANHGTVNAATLTAGKKDTPNSGYLFDGIRSNISIPKPFFNGSRVSRFSIATTFKLNQYSLPVGSIWTKNGFWQGVGISISPDGTIGFGTSIPTFQYQGANSSIGVIELNKWYSIVMVYDDVNCTLYVNGIIVQTTNGTSSQSGAFISNNMAGFVDFAQTAGGNSNSTNLFGCGNSVSTGNTDFFNGIIDDFRIYNRVLTQQEITYLANN